MSQKIKTINGCRTDCGARWCEGDPCPYLLYTAPYGQSIGEKRPHSYCTLLNQNILMELLPNQEEISNEYKRFRSIRPKECPVTKPNLFNWKEKNP